ncbi:MAG TPA: hypothetical protein VNP04_16355 [Alphaproteobacteria bacterium]|nr:hypothetical protein [Alphaproteobacteria bacterium]
MLLKLALALVMVALVGCSSNMAGTHSQVFYILGVHSLIIPEAELPSLKHEALKGSPDAAFRLSLYYESVRLDFKEGLFWTQIAAENGHPSGQYNYGFRLRNDPDPRNRLRARFWLERAAENGVSLAVDLLKELSE